MNPKIIVYTIILATLTLPCFAQEIGINTNLLYWGTTTPNLGVEISLSKKVTFDVQGAYNPWMFSDKETNKKLKHWIIQPELRLWNCEKFVGGFWGIHAHYGRYNMGGVKLPFGIFPALERYRYEGWFVGGGISYGYQWYLSPRWNLQAIIGVGYAYTDYKQYECRRCGKYIGKDDRHYVGPTKAGISLIYLIKTKK